MKTRPTQEYIPPGIEAKLFHKDRAFFRTFTRRHDTRPPHQKQFQAMLNDAIEKFKEQNNAYVLNKTNKDQIFDLLRKKLAIDFWTNEEFSNLDSYECSRYTLYLAGFAKIKVGTDFDTLRNIISDIKTSMLQPLPDTPDGIDHNLRQALPFQLPLEDRKQIRAIAITLRQAFSFDLLPASYIADKRIPLPDKPKDLNSATRSLFLITSRLELKKFKSHKKILETYYIFSRVPHTYFDLPPKKQPLPLTPQDLPPCLQKIFPFYPTSSDHFRETVKLLRENYVFQSLPNDYLISKKRLPANPELLGLKKFSFPICNKEMLSDFLATLPRYYAIPEPLPKAYASFNYTEKPDLPTDPELVTQVNLTLPIKTPKELTIAARALRHHYFFHAIPTEWIDIPPTQVPLDEPPKLPLDNESLNAYIKNKNLSPLTFPITEQAMIPQATEFLRNTFSFNSLPDSLFNVPTLNPPSWNLFEKMTQTTHEDIEMAPLEPTDRDEDNTLSHQE